MLECLKCEIKNNKMKPFNTKMYCDDCTKIIKKIYKQKKDEDE